MRRLRLIDLALLGSLLPIWLVCFALHVREVVRTGYAVPPIFASPGGGTDAYPRVGGLRSETFHPQPGLEVGDRLLRVADVDLRGVGYFAFYGIVMEQVGPDLRVPVEYERGGERGRVELAFSRPPLPWVRIPGLLAIALAAVLVLLRAPQRAQARRFFLAFMTLSIVVTPFDGPSYAQTTLAQVIQHLSGGLAVALVLRWALLFPDEVAPGGRIAARWAWLPGLLWYAGRLDYVLGGPIPTHLLPALTLALDILIGISVLAILTWNYHRAAPIGRRRIKWVVLGAYVGILALVPTAAGGLLYSSRAWIAAAYWVGALAWPVLPLALLAAMVRYNLFDVDRLISATVSYNALLVVFAGLAFAVVPRVAQDASAAAGIDPSAGGMLLSLLLAALVVPAQRRLRPRIDRLFFPEAHRLEEGMGDLIVELASVREPRALVQLAGERLEALLRPETCVVHLANENGYAPVFVMGREAPPAFGHDDPLAAVLRRQRTPLVNDGSGRRRPGPGGPGGFERVALETLGASVVVPLRRGSDLSGTLCLGPKRSGDVYTSTDLALLMAVAEKISAQLGLRPETRGSSASGTAAEVSSRVSTILFSDIVGSTPLLRRLGDERAHPVLEGHHRRMREVIGECGGELLQWLGDGVMASFASSADAVRCGIAMQRAAQENLEGERLWIRVGINVGEILRQASGSGHFGIAIVTARRLCDRAQGGQILCSHAVVEVLSGHPEHRFRDLGRWELKGVEIPIAVCEVLDPEADPG